VCGRFADRGSDANPNRYAHRHTAGDAYGYTNRDTDGDPDHNANRDTNCDADGDPDRNANCDTDCDPDTHADARAGPIVAVGVGSARLGGTRQASSQREPLAALSEFARSFTLASRPPMARAHASARIRRAGARPHGRESPRSTNHPARSSSFVYSSVFSSAAIAASSAFALSIWGEFRRTCSRSRLAAGASPRAR
jgi:hypothetical protein